MKVLLLFVFLFYVSCSHFRETVGYQKYPIPNGNKILLVPTVSSFHSDDYIMEKEIIQQIIEDLGRRGFLVIEGDEVHEFKDNTNEGDHFSFFYKQLSPNILKNESRITHWMEKAIRLQIPYIIFVRFPKQLESDQKLVRMFWLHLNERQTEQFDWKWKFDSHLPLSKMLSGGK
ncbi:hypothetical protein AB3N60_04790 [Leptospira sp. WS39.C2]